MAFRDDREALRQRTAELEAEVEAQRAQVEKTKALEAELVRTRHALHEMEQKLPTRKNRASPPAVLLGGLVAVAVAGAVMSFALVRRGPPPPPPSPVSHPALPRAVAPPSDAAPAREVKTHWVGRVKSATGLALDVGASCRLDATLRTPKGTELVLACGDKVLYRSTDPLDGVSQHGWSLGEVPGPTSGTARQWLLWDDVGTRTGERAQASIDTKLGVASAWRETQPNYRVDVEIEPFSEPASGTMEAAHTEMALAFTDRVHKRGKLAKVAGPAPLSAGAACELWLGPDWGAQTNCRAVVSCDGKVIYGAGTTGFSKCAVSSGKPVSFLDDTHDTDGVLTWKLGGATASLGALAGAEEWTAEINLDP